MLNYISNILLALRVYILKRIKIIKILITAEAILNMKANKLEI
jgi:hypothetical protein